MDIVYYTGKISDAQLQLAIAARLGVQYVEILRDSDRNITDHIGNALYDRIVDSIMSLPLADLIQLLGLNEVDSDDRE